MEFTVLPQYRSSWSSQRARQTGEGCQSHVDVWGRRDVDCRFWSRLKWQWPWMSDLDWSWQNWLLLVLFFLNYSFDLLISKSNSKNLDHAYSKDNMIWKSDVNRELNGSRPGSYGLNPIVHKVCHYEQMDYLRYHKPVSHIFRKETTRFVSVELGICKHPENYEKDSRNGLCSYKMGCISLNITLLSYTMIYFVSEEDKLTENGECF